MVTKTDLTAAVAARLAEQGMSDRQIAASLCCDELDSFDEAFFADFGGLAVLTACGIEVGGKACDIQFVVGGAQCVCSLQFGACLDVGGANRAIERYLHHPLSRLLSVQNEIRRTRDSLILTCIIDCADCRQLSGGLTNLFRLLNENKDVLAHLCAPFAPSGR